MDTFYQDLLNPNIIDDRDLGYETDNTKSHQIPYVKEQGNDLKEEYTTLELMNALPEFTVPSVGRVVNRKMRIYKWLFTLKKPKKSTLGLIAYTFFRHFNELRKKLSKGSKVQIIFGIQRNIRVISLPLLNPNKVTLKMILELLSRDEHYQSIVLKDMMINVKEVKVRRGGAGIKDPRRCVYGFQSDGYCGQKCLLVQTIDKKKAKMLLQKKNDIIFTKKAIELGDMLEKKGCLNGKYVNTPTMSFEDFDAFTEVNTDYQIIIFKCPNDFSPYRSKTKSNDPKKIYIAFENDHYLPINNVQAYVRTVNTKRLFCETCFVCHDKRAKKPHICEGLQCNYCYTKYSTKEAFRLHSVIDPTHCDKCNMFIRYGNECKIKHEEKCKALIIQCKMCGINYDEDAIHTCSAYKCIYCCKMVEEGHVCYIDTYRKSLKVKKYSPWVWDIESAIDENNQHTPSKICAISFEGEKVTFNNLTCFVNYFISLKCQVKLFAHNAKAYDTYLLRVHLIENMNLLPKSVLMRGQKILFMSFKNIHFLDSMNHIQGSLQSQIKTFGLSVDNKGFFPYTFYTPDKKNYIGNVPPIKYFNKQCIDPQFNEWYTSFDTNTYNIDEECEKYCYQDCEILRQALISYQSNAITENNLDPLEFVTLPSYAQKVYLMSHYCENEKTPLAHLSKEVDLFIQESFKGGRTEVFKLRASGNLKYIDVSSMYPTVQKFDLLPYGKPIEFSGSLEDVNNDEIGFIDCRVICPHMHIPLLMIHDAKTDKLIAPTGSFRGTWTTHELIKAVSLGYKITKKYKGYKFKAVRGMFSSYVDKYYKGKTDAKENNNQGKAALCKLMLNSLWGKFAQKNNLDKNDYITNPTKWFEIVDDESREIKTFESTPDGNLFVRWKWDQDDMWETSNNMSFNTRNIALASAITACARLRLYEVMEDKGTDICYVDTDSCIYVDTSDTSETVETRSVSDTPVSNAVKLGDWELEAEITEFVAIGPKSYAYITSSGEEVAKCKGFSADWITFEKYQSIIDNRTLTHTYETLEFKRTPHGISTSMLTKELSFVFNKRALGKGYETTPLEVLQ